MQLKVFHIDLLKPGINLAKTKLCGPLCLLCVILCNIFLIFKIDSRI